MFSHGLIPLFKTGDLVRSLVDLPIVYTLRARYENTVWNSSYLQWFSVQNIPVDRSPVQGLPIKRSVVFEVDAVLPWDAPAECNTNKRYRLVLNPRRFEELAELDRQWSEAEFSSLRIIMAEDERDIPFFYLFADEEEIERVAHAK
jgi:hypothetical protein